MPISSCCARVRRELPLDEHALSAVLRYLPLQPNARGREGREEKWLYCSK